jgi:O-antigen/teichoic acid export membrane protein
LYDFIEIWLLQLYGGNTQQALYAIAFQIASISAVATSACVNIYWKEITEARYLNNFKYIQYIYTKTIKNLMLLTISISAFIYPWLNEIIKILLGDSYEGGGEVLGIMLFFPLLQALSQMSATTFYAYEKIKIQALVVILTMLVSIVTTYLFIAPQSAYIPGLNLGAWGFAVKTVLIQLLVVSTSLFLLSSKLKIVFAYKSLISIGFFCIAFGFISKFLVLNIFLIKNIFINLFISGLIFSILIFVSIFLFPKIFGFYKRDLFFYKIQIY